MPAVERRRPSRLDLVDARARTLWPQVSRQELERCDHDPSCVADVVDRTTDVPQAQARELLMLPVVAPDETERWFG